MGRRLRGSKKLIHVFCEGESEQAYTEFLRKTFRDVAVIKQPRSPGLFEEASSRFEKDKHYRDEAEIIDEIWFFFDVEKKDVDKWYGRKTIINTLRRLRGNAKIRVRLFMTTGCLEYWLMLHYKLFAPPLTTVAEKNRMLEEIRKQEPHYEKGNQDITAKIAAHYGTAVSHAETRMMQLLQEGLPGLDDTDERNQWLVQTCPTFSTVHEAIRFLETLKR